MWCILALSRRIVLSPSRDANLGWGFSLATCQLMRYSISFYSVVTRPWGANLRIFCYYGKISTRTASAARIGKTKTGFFAQTERCRVCGGQAGRWRQGLDVGAQGLACRRQTTYKKKMISAAVGAGIEPAPGCALWATRTAGYKSAALPLSHPTKRGSARGRISAQSPFL